MLYDVQYNTSKQCYRSVIASSKWQNVCRTLRGWAGISINCKWKIVRRSLGRLQTTSVSGSAVDLMIQVAKTLGARGFYRPITTVTSAPILGGVDHVLCDFNRYHAGIFAKKVCRSGEMGSLMPSKSNVFGDLTAPSQEIDIKIRGVLSLIKIEVRSFMPYEVDLMRGYRHTEYIRLSDHWTSHYI